LYDEKAVHKRVIELAALISKDYAGKEVILIGILKGASIFTTDLAKRLTISARLDFMSVSSYGDTTENTSGAVKILLDVRQPLQNQHVIVVEDIVDTGLTLKYLLKHLSGFSPASLNCCVLLKKPSRLKVKDLDIKYVGFEIPDKWVVGFGMDYAEKYRTLPFIGVLKEEVYRGK